VGPNEATLAILLIAMNWDQMSDAVQDIDRNWIDGSNYLSILAVGNIYVPEVLNFSVHRKYVFRVLEMHKNLCHLFPMAFGSCQKANFYDKMLAMLEKTWVSLMKA